MRERFRARAPGSVFVGIYPLLILSGALIVGCASDSHGPTTRPMTTRERQDAALRDPFNYSPDFDQTDSNSDWDKYDSPGMKRDIDHVLNP